MILSEAILLAAVAALPHAAGWPIKRTLNDVMACLTAYDEPQGFQTDGLRHPVEWIDGPDARTWQGNVRVHSSAYVAPLQNTGPPSSS